MAAFRFHLVGVHQPIELEVEASAIREVAEILTRQRFIEGHLSRSDENGVLLGMLLSTYRIECVCEIE